MRRALVLVCSSVGLLLASCSSTPPSNSAPETVDSSTGPSKSPSSSQVPAGVPQVTDPIDMTQYKKRPCSALAEPQLQKLSLPVQGESQLDSVAGPECEWDAYDETGIVVSGTTVTAGSSLAGSYAKNERGGFENFKPITVAGHPGYINWDGNLNCSAAVGVRNDLLYIIVVTVDKKLFQPGKHCEIAKQAAELATKTMSGGS